MTPPRETSRGCRLLIVSNIPNPYNDALFAQLAGQPGLALKVVYCAEREANRSWTLPKDKGYDYVILRGVQVGRLGRFNPGVFGVLSRFRPSVVVVTGSYAYPTMQLLMWWLSIRGTPWYYWAEELEWGRKGWLVAMMRKVFRSAIRRARGVLAIGRRSAASYERLGVPRERIRQFHYYAATDHFELPAATRAQHRASVRSAHALPPGATVILFMGQMIHRKGVDLLLRAFAQLDQRGDAYLLLAGDGPDSGALQAMAQELGISDRARFVGFVQPSDLPRYTAACDAIVVPSRKEGWGLVVPEAMAAGIPVIASDQVSAGNDLIEHGKSGFLFPITDTGALAAILRQVVESRELRERISAAAMVALEPERTSVAAARLVTLVCESQTAGAA